MKKTRKKIWKPRSIRIYNCLPSLCVLPNVVYHFSWYSLGVAFLLMGWYRYRLVIRITRRKRNEALKRILSCARYYRNTDIIMYQANRISFNSMQMHYHFRCAIDARHVSLTGRYYFSFFFLNIYVRIYFWYNLFYSNSCRYYSNCDPRGGSSGASHINYEQCGDSGWSYSAVCTGPGHSIFCPRCAFASFPIRES